MRIWLNFGEEENANKTRTYSVEKSKRKEMVNGTQSDFWNRGWRRDRKMGQVTWLIVLSHNEHIISSDGGALTLFPLRGGGGAGSLRLPVFNLGSTVTPVGVMLCGFWSHKRWFSFCLVFFWRLALDSSPTMLGSPSSLRGLTQKPAPAPGQMSEQAFTWVTTPSFKSSQLKSWFRGAEKRCYWCSLPEFSTYNNVST